MQDTIKGMYPFLSFWLPFILLLPSSLRPIFSFPPSHLPSLPLPVFLFVSIPLSLLLLFSLSPFHSSPSFPPVLHLLSLSPSYLSSPSLPPFVSSPLFPPPIPSFFRSPFNPPSLNSSSFLLLTFFTSSPHQTSTPPLPYPHPHHTGWGGEIHSLGPDL